MRLRGIPVLLIALALIGLSMLLPALFGALERDWRSARLFLYSGVFVVFCAFILGAAARRPGGGRSSGAEAPRSELLTMGGFFLVVPGFAAMPIWLLHPTLGANGAYFEALSSLTTTGATLFDRPGDIARALNLWRAMLGWFGGAATLIVAAAILAPRNLIDTPGAGNAGAASSRAGRVMALGPGGERVMRATLHVAPIYVGLTAALAAGLASVGSPSFVALVHAMGVMSTSGITVLDGGFAALDNRWAEAVALVFMIAAASRLPFRQNAGRAPLLRVARNDPELKLLALTVAVASGWLFGRHWLGALTLSGPGSVESAGLVEALHGGFVAAWGAVATSVSFLTTTGYASADWAEAQDWSGLENPAIMLLGLAALGGGVASTAGGVKLFRAYSLFKHSSAEIARLIHPHMVDTTRTGGGRLTRQGIVNAWVFMMLFMAALAVSLTALTLTGMGFDTALVAAVAALSNTGPAFPLLMNDPGAYGLLSLEARMILCLVMVLGRIEVLVLVALFNPGYWRK